MSNIQPAKLSKEAFKHKLEQLSEDLESGKMWMNDRCEMQAKDHRFVRWLKVLLRTFLPLNFYNSIKIERVALNYFEFVKAHKEHLVHVVTLGSANRVLTLLNKTTHGKYAKLLSAFKDAIVGNVSQEAFAEETAKQKENLLQARTTFYQLADRFQNKLESLESLTNQRADLSVEGNEKENSQSNEIFQPEEKIQTHSQLKLSTNSQANQENFHENQTDIETVSKIDKLKESVPIMAEKKAENFTPTPIFIFHDAEMGTSLPAEILRRNYPNYKFISDKELHVLDEYKDKPVMAYYLMRFEGRFEGPQYFVSELKAILGHANINLTYLAFTRDKNIHLNQIMDQIHSYLKNNQSLSSSQEAKFFEFLIPNSASKISEFEENFMNCIQESLPKTPLA